ncbi:HAD family hydrolase [Haliangium ochraceum]|uniref:phosphoglycolate phosphatase n=1 Tax=Haliangium ochraceum (strain DSM 14365 / JCM 11303 / SMP-2) TaxID=502025 RepID=D0LM25_HALO1|nr:HAD family hydrolase [Haliangium ochraceum]ACY15203.1 Haloacid dehalogenase domain protein hydrolase [Haliangium ochraceum DSM 14365]
MLYLFDIDGTILLSGGAGVAALDCVFREQHGIEAAMHGISPAGKTDPLIIAEVFERHLQRAPTADEIARILDAYAPVLRDTVRASEGYRLMPAVRETLAFLAGEPGVYLALATGNIRVAAQTKLERADLWKLFAVGGFGCDSEDRAQLVARAIERAREHSRVAYSDEEIVVVGDTVRDIAAARACRVRVLAVATGGQDRGTLAAAEPDAVFDTLAELPAWHRQQMAARGASS